MFTVNQLAIQSNAPAHVVRYYARIGLIQPSAQQQNGYRLFASKVATRLRFIRMAKLLGFTLNEIKQITQHADMEQSPCGNVRKIIQHRIFENRTRINEMIKLQSRMELALEQWELMPDGMPDGHSVCHLIESFDDDIESGKLEEKTWRQ